MLLILLVNCVVGFFGGRGSMLFILLVVCVVFFFERGSMLGGVYVAHLVG
jgi:hypothetical protein